MPYYYYEPPRGSSYGDDYECDDDYSDDSDYYSDDPDRMPRYHYHHRHGRPPTSKIHAASSPYDRRGGPSRTGISSTQSNHYPRLEVMTATDGTSQGELLLDPSSLCDASASLRFPPLRTGNSILPPASITIRMDSRRVVRHPESFVQSIPLARALSQLWSCDPSIAQHQVASVEPQLLAWQSRLSSSQAAPRVFEPGAETASCGSCSDHIPVGSGCCSHPPPRSGHSFPGGGMPSVSPGASYNFTMGGVHPTQGGYSRGFRPSTVNYSGGCPTQ
ncbi:hypothetical protein I316_00234 [Kwoniella heveanensis BCC8398]|uniref:Uncharacterized protein n=1 Tax=Kwoniella heveanensis BCC8398 TaxID=1296120 RepID=A0A1B9H426_9TREE|nr:hypothetical protein I316_00234 [Kwoniella heveanensis BCC8398]